MSKVSLDDAHSLLGVDCGEIFAVRGHGHNGTTWHSTEFKSLFTKNNLYRIFFEADRTKIVKYGDTRCAVLACEVFSCVVC